jgi:YidC/Oxa1 family membrane protein insertase
MSIDLFTPFNPVIEAAYGALTAVADALHPLAGSAAAPLAVVAFTMAVRALMLPLSRASLRGMGARLRLAPEVEKLRRRHGRDQARLQREMAELYRREGISPLRGCLPALVQAPFFMVLYRVVSAPLIGGHANVLLDNAVFGVPLGGHLVQVFTGALGLPGLLAFACLATAIAAVAWWSSRTTLPGAPVTRLQRIAPFATLLSLAVVPFAAGLYVLTSSAWATAERAVVYRRMTAAG